MRLEDCERVQRDQSPEKLFLVYLKDVTVKLHGFCLDIPSFGIMPNDLEAIIGGNGAGKTTLCDVISGKTRVTDGQVFFKGVEITRKPESEIAASGIGRKFQTPTVFDSLTVVENLELAHQGSNGVWWSAFRNTGPKEQKALEEQMRRMGLSNDRHKPAGLLSHGKRQWLELSMLILSGCDLLLVDEPTAGLTDQEVGRTAEILLGLRSEHTIIVIEHNMDFVQRLGSMVTFLHKGAVLDYGTYESIQGNPEVLESYWGVQVAQ